MSEQGSDKTSQLRDDEYKRELRNEMQANRSTRMQEEREPEPSGEDQPDADYVPNALRTGGAPPGMTPEDVALRYDLARFLGTGAYPADREQLLGTLRGNHAPDALLELAAQLPVGRTYRNTQEVAEALGLGVEEHRT